MSETKNIPTAIEMANTIKSWWDRHKHDTSGDYGLCNVYDTEPEFVTQAKAVIGDWEKGTFTVESFLNSSQYRDYQTATSLGGFTTLAEAQAFAERPEFDGHYEVVVAASGPHLEFTEGSVVYRRFNRSDSNPGSADVADEDGWFDVEAYRTRERWDGLCFGDESLDGFMKFEDAKAYADHEKFNDFFQVVVIAYGEHVKYERGETVYSRFSRPELD